MMSDLRRGFVYGLIFIVFLITANALRAQSGSPPGRPYKHDLWRADAVSANEVNGVASYSFPVELPKGRNGLTPSLSIDYSSQNKAADGPLGYAWDISIPTISRLNKFGVKKIYDQNNFTSSLGGELKPVSLADGKHGTYGQKVDSGDFLEYIYNSDNSWTIKRKDGTVFKFGAEISSVENDPSNTNNIYTWYLSRIEDKNGNYIVYEYEKLNNKVYPKSIFYTGFGQDKGIFTVEFSKEQRPNGEAIILYKSGFEIKSDQRIKEITVKINGQTTRKYALKYTTVDTGKMSLLETIDFTAFDSNNNSLTLPSTKFTYLKNQTQVEWKEDLQEKLPTEVFFSDQYDIGNPNSYVKESRQRYMMDVNGDGLVDYVLYGQSYNSDFRSHDSGFGVSVILKNKDGTFEQTYSTEYKISFTQKSDSELPPLGRFADINGDNLLDIIFAYEDTYSPIYKVFLNTGSGWVENSTWKLPPVSFVSRVKDPSRYFEGYLTDVNGDSLSDIVIYNQSRGFNIAVYINNGIDGWTQDSDFSLSYTSKYNFENYASATHLADLNGDGLPEVLFGYKTEMGFLGNEKKAYINTGKGWKETSLWNESVPFFVDNPSFYGLSYFNNYQTDINGDGLVDIAGQNQSFDGANTHINFGVNPNDGTGSFSSLRWNFKHLVGVQNVGDAVRFNDFDGDGLIDLAVSYRTFMSPVTCQTAPNGCFQKIYKNNGVVSNLLSKIEHSSGATTEIVYKGTPQYKDKNGNIINLMPFVFSTVSAITTNDGFGNKSATTYEYSGGCFYYKDPSDKQFAGFEKVTKFDPAGNYLITYYHQGNATDSSMGEYQDHFSKIGMPYRVEKYDSLGKLLSSSINTWDSFDLGSNRYFVNLKQKIDSEYDADNPVVKKSTSIAYQYDNSTGDKIKETKFGFVSATDDGKISDIDDDKIEINLSYAKSYLKEMTALDFSSNKISSFRYYYDGLGLGAVDKGNLTKEEIWLDTKSKYVATQELSYLANGLVKEQRDAYGRTTHFSYDPYNLYPIKIVNPIGHTIEKTNYEYQNGQPGRIIEANKRITETIFDAFARPLEVKGSDSNDSQKIVSLKKFQYKDTFPRLIREFDYLDDSNVVEGITYYDGLDRSIQKKKRAEDGNFTTTDFIYDHRGLLIRESLPYFSGTISSTSPTMNSNLYISYTYDGLNRIVEKTDVTGSESIVYKPSKKFIIDKLSNKKGYSFNAFGETVAVEEYSENQIYTTRYDHNPVGHLLGKPALSKIIDSKGNIRNFVNDSIGRLISSSDLHGPADATVGVHSYDYDDVGNMIVEIQPNGDKIFYLYDSINRLTLKKILPFGVPSCLADSPSCSCQGDWMMECWSSLWQGSKNSKNWVDGSDICVPYNSNTWEQTCPNGISECSCNNNAQWRELSSKYGGTAAFMTCSPPVTSETKNWGWWNTGCVPPETKSGPKCTCQGDWKLSCWSSWWNGFKEASYWPEGSDVCVPFNYKNWNQTCPNEAPRCTCDSNAGWTELSSTYGSVASTMTCSPNISSDSKNWGWLLVDSEKRSTSRQITTVQYAYDEDGISKPANVGKLTSVIKGSFSQDYNYDANGNLIEKTTIIDGNKVDGTVQYRYNRQNLVVEKNYFNSEIVENNEYNEAGLLEKTFVRINQGNVIPYVSQIDYNPLGKIATLKQKDIIETENSYDQNKLYRLLNRKSVAKVRESTKTLSPDVQAKVEAALATNDQSKLGSLFEENKDELQQEYTKAVLSCSLFVEDDKFVSKELQNISYLYDAVGNILKLEDNSHVDSAKSIIYEYDDLYRLTKAQTLSAFSPKNNYLKTYRYDNIGNMTYNSDVGIMIYGESQRSPYATPQAVTKINSAEVVYDENGRVIEDQQQFYRWDADDRLIETKPKADVKYYNYDTKNNSTLAQNSSVRYEYDHSGNRIKKSVGGLIYYYLDSGVVLVFDDQSKTVIKKIFHVNGGTIEKFGSEYQTYFSVEDHLGGSIAVVDGKYNLSELIDYAPFGQITLKKNYAEFDELKKFTGHEMDYENNLTYAGARYYNQAIGRWISPDPVVKNLMANESKLDQVLLNPQILNSYSYVANNPLKYIDPNGEFLTQAKALLYRVGLKVVELPVAITVNAAIGLGLSVKEWTSAVGDLLQGDYEGSNQHSHNVMTVLAYTALMSADSLLATNKISQKESQVVGNGNVQKGLPNGCSWAQKNYSEKFSNGGKFSGKTIDDVANELKSGLLKPSDVSIDVIVRDGNALILNTRSTQSLLRADIPVSQWNIIYRTGQEAYEARLTGQLTGNGLTNKGIDYVISNGK